VKQIKYIKQNAFKSNNYSIHGIKKLKKILFPGDYATALELNQLITVIQNAANLR